MKKGISIITSFLTLLLMNFVSAASYYSPFSYFSIRDYLYSIDPQSMTLAIVFIVLFAFIFYGLSRTLKNSAGEPNTIISAVISFAISAFAVYGINRSNFDITNIFYNIGISGDAIIWIISIFAILIALFLIKKFRFSGFFMISGILMVSLVIFTDVIFKEGIFTGVGIILFILGIIIKRYSGDRITSRDGNITTTSFGGGRSKRKDRKTERKLKINIKNEIKRLKGKKKSAKNSYERGIYIQEIERLQRNLRGF